jgi:hypothetical protein
LRHANSRPAAAAWPGLKIPCSYRSPFSHPSEWLAGLLGDLRPADSDILQFALTDDKPDTTWLPGTRPGMTLTVHP